MKKPSTRDELTKLREMMEQLRDSVGGNQAEQDNAFLYQLLYGTVARYGLQLPNKPDGVVATVQIPVLQMPANHTLTWQELEGSQTVILQIIEVPESDSVEGLEPQSNEVGGRTESDSDVELANPGSSSAPTPITTGDPVDEFDAEVARSIKEMGE